MLEQRVALEYEPHAPPQGDEPRLRWHGSRSQCKSVDANRSRIERLERGDRAQCGRLADARRTHQRHHLAARDLEG